MIDFDLEVGRSMGHALELLNTRADTMPVAGGTDLIPLARVGRWQPGLVVDITQLEALHFIKPLEDGLEIGALTSHAELICSQAVSEHAPALVEAAASVAGPQVRARGTLGGNLCTASPAADTVPALLMLDAQVVIVSLEGERRLPLAEFLTGPGQTALKPGEMLKSVFIPTAPAGASMAFEKLGKRKALIISVANAAALLLAEEGRIHDARLALGAVAPTVVRCPAAEAFLMGREPDESTFPEAAHLIQETIQPIDDVRASAAYRRVAAEGLAARALVRAWEGCAT